MSKYDRKGIQISFISGCSPLLVDRYPSFPLPSSALVPGHISITQPVHRVFGACTRLVRGLRTHPRGVSRITASRYDVCPHNRVLSIRRNRVHPLGHSPILAYEGPECGDLRVHDLDGTCLPRSIRGLYRMERKCHQLGTTVVRFLYVYTPPRSVLISDKFIQLFASKSPLASRGPPAFSASFAASIISLPLPLRRMLRARCVVG